MTERNSAKVVNLAFLCAILVVTIHLSRPDAHAPVARAIRELTRGGISRMAVPMFFAFSGYFLARRAEGIGWWKAQLLKRARTLLVPYVIWISVVFVHKVLLDGVAPWYDVTTLRGFAKVYGLNLFGMPLLGAMWYVRDLMIFSLAAPMLFALLRKFGVVVLVVLFVAYGILSPGEPPHWLVFPKTMTQFFRSGISLEGVFYFCLGSYLYWHPVVLSRRTGIVCGGAALLLILLRLACLHEHWQMPVCLRTFFIPLSMAAAWTFAPEARWPDVLGKATFPIFAMHGLVIKSSRVFIELPHDAGFWLLQLMLAVAIPIIISWLMRRLLPRTASVLWGGR